MAARLATYRDGLRHHPARRHCRQHWRGLGLARFAPEDLTIVPEGQDAEAVLPLPPAALRLSPPHIDLCQRLGLDTVTELARFRCRFDPPFRPDTGFALEQALGQAGESLNPYLPPPQFQAQQKSAARGHAIEALAALVIVRGIGAQLQQAGQGAQRLDLALTRSDNAVMALSLPLAHPSADAAHMLRLFEERLTRLSAGWTQFRY